MNCGVVKSFFSFVISGLLVLLAIPPMAMGESLQDQIDTAMERITPAVVQINTATAMGAGFIVSDKLVVTNNHVIADAGDGGINVFLRDGRRMMAKLVYQEEHPDLAVLSLMGNVGDTVQPLRFADMSKVRPGLLVMTIGHPGGMEFSVALGVVSSVGRPGANPIEYFLQTDAAINSGNSGGPLVNLQGEVVGINTMKLEEAGGQRMESIGFALAGNIVKRVIADLVKYGQVRRPYIGISEAIEVAGLKAQQHGVAPGSLQLTVTEGGPIFVAGLRDTDILTTLNGRAIQGLHGFWVELHKYELGQEVAFTAVRDGMPFQAKVVLAPRDSGFAWTRVGAEIAENLRVLKVRSGSVFGLAGLQSDDRILKVRVDPTKGFDPISSLDELKRYVKQSATRYSPMGVIVKRKDATVELEPVDFSPLMAE